MSKADLLLPISTAVDGQLADIGVPASRRQVMPSGVDTELFRPGPPDDELITTYRMDGEHRVGWVGGFRPFHGLELLPTIADRLHEELPRAVLYLVGTGPLRKQLEAQMAGREWVRLIGPVPHQDVPRWIRSFDVAVLLAGSKSFHYSPLKLYEYLACGAPVVAPDVGDIGREVVDGRQAMLVPPNDPEAVVDAVRRLVAGSEVARLALTSSAGEGRSQLLVGRACSLDRAGSPGEEAARRGGPTWLGPRRPRHGRSGACLGAPFGRSECCSSERATFRTSEARRSARTTWPLRSMPEVTP